MAFEFSYCKFEDYHVPAGEYGSTLTDDMRGFFIDAMICNVSTFPVKPQAGISAYHISFMLLSSTSPTKSVAGIHWNFFFTIAVVSLVSTTTDSWPRIIQILRVSHSVSLHGVNEPAVATVATSHYQSTVVLDLVFSHTPRRHTCSFLIFLSSLQKLSLRDFWL